MGGNIKDGHFSLVANVQVPLDSAGQLRLSDLQGFTVEDLVPQLTHTGSAVSATLPFQGQLGGPTVVSGTISIPSYDPFSGSPTVSLDSNLAPFLTVSAHDVAGLLGQLPTWADSLRNSSAFSVQVPLTGASLGSLFDLKSLVSQAFAKASPDTSGTLDFADANSLAQLLPGVVTNVAYDKTDPNHPLLVYHAHIASNVSPASLPLKFTTKVGSLANLSSSAQLTASPAANLDFDLGVDLSPLGTTFQFVPVPGNTLLGAEWRPRGDLQRGCGGGQQPAFWSRAVQHRCRQQRTIGQRLVARAADQRHPFHGFVVERRHAGQQLDRRFDQRAECGLGGSTERFCVLRHAGVLRVRRFRGVDGLRFLDHEYCCQRAPRLLALTRRRPATRTLRSHCTMVSSFLSA